MSEEILGTIYTGSSDDFLRGVYPIARTIKATKPDLAIVIRCGGGGGGGDSLDVKQVGNLIDKGGWDNPQRGRIYATDGCCPTLNTCQGGQREPKVIVSMRGRNPENPSDRTAGIPLQQRLEPNSQGISNTLTSVQKDNMVLERFFDQATEVLMNNDCEEGDTIDPFNKKVNKSGISPTITTRPEGFKTAILPVTKQANIYRIRKLTPLECWRLMSFSDKDFEKAASKKQNYDWSDFLCNVKLTDAKEKQSQKDLETYVLCTIKDILKQVATKTEWTKYQKEQEIGKIQNVNIAIIKSENMARLECVISTIKCTDFTVTLYGSTKEKGQHLHTVIIGLEKEGKGNTGKYMKITSEENLNPLKLSIILTVLRLITESKIYTSTLQEVRICQLTWNLENYGKCTEKMPTLNLKMECIYTRISSSQLYKEAGNSIVENCLIAIFSQLGIKGVQKWNDGLKDKYR